MEDMRFVVADASREMHSGKVEKATFLAPHMEAVKALFCVEAVSAVGSR